MRFLLLLAGLLPAAAQARTTHDMQVWGNATLMSGFGQRGLYFIEAQPRFGDGATRLSQLLLRGVGTLLSPRPAVLGRHSAPNVHPRSPPRPTPHMYSMRMHFLWKCT